MTPEEQVEGLIREGANHSFPMGITDASEIQRLFRNYTNSLATTHEELTCKVQEHIESYYRPINVVFIKLHTYVVYRGIKIPTKGLYNQCKNKFTSRVCKRVLPTPIDVVPTEDPNDKYRFNINMVFNTID